MSPTNVPTNHLSQNKCRPNARPTEPSVGFPLSALILDVGTGRSEEMLQRIVEVSFGLRVGIVPSVPRTLPLNPKTEHQAHNITCGPIDLVDGSKRRSGCQRATFHVMLWECSVLQSSHHVSWCRAAYNIYTIYTPLDTCMMRRCCGGQNILCSLVLTQRDRHRGVNAGSTPRCPRWVQASETEADNPQDSSTSCYSMDCLAQSHPAAPNKTGQQIFQEHNPCPNNHGLLKYSWKICC